MVLTDKRYYRPDELARELERTFGWRVARSTVYEWIRRGKIGHVHVGKRLVITRAEVQRALSGEIGLN